MHLVRDIRIIETALGDGVKKVFPGELAPLSKLRRVGAYLHAGRDAPVR